MNIDEMSKKKGKKTEAFSPSIVDEMEASYNAMREWMRPLTEEEKIKLEKLIELGAGCTPDDKDAFSIMRLLRTCEIFDLEDDESSSPQEIAFSLGMAYERLRRNKWKI